MRHTWHHLSWLLRRFRTGLILYAAVWAVVGSAVWLVPDDSKLSFRANSIFAFFHTVLPLGGLAMLLEALRQDAAPGTGEFWRTRPPRWRAVWCSQALFATVFIAGPPLLVWFINGLRLHSNALQWRYGLVDALLVVAPILVLAGIVSFARHWYGLMLSFVLAAGCLIAGVWLHLSWPRWLRSGWEEDGRYQLAGILLAPVVVLTFSWVWGMRRSGVLWRAVCTGTALILGPSIMSGIHLSGVYPQQIELTAAWNPRAGLRGADGFIDYHALDIQGVPKNTLAVVTENDGINLRFFEPAADGTGKASSPEVWALPDLPVSDGRNRFTSIPAQPLRALFPEDTHWYSEIAGGEYRSGEARSLEAGLRALHSSTNSESRATGILLRGRARGFLISAIRLAALNLESDAVSAENGTRLLMRGFSSNERHLDFTVEVWRSASLAGATDPAGLQMDHGFYEFPALAVLHFPALHMAILANAATRNDDFRSWQCTNRSFSIHTHLPAAEVIRGVRLTPETLRGAQVVLCVPVLTGHFTLTPPAEPFTFPGRSAAETPETRAVSLLQTMDYNGLEWAPDKLPETAVELLKLGAPALRTMLSYEWHSSGGPLSVPHAAMELWRALTDEFLPDLQAAIRREPRWLEVARLIEKEAPLAPTALEMLRSTHAPLNERVIAAAVTLAKREDYERLRHHVAIASGMDTNDLLLWWRLRALPDFPWRELARLRWREWYDADRGAECSALCAAAALAGDGPALNELLEHDPLESGFLDPEEWDELVRKVEGIPAVGSVPKWLRKNRGNFLWDEAPGKYRLPK